MTTAQGILISISGQRWISWLTDGFGWPARKRQLLDVRDLSPHLQRDLGVLDGNDLTDRRR